MIALLTYEDDPRRYSRAATGYTLVELLVVVTIISVLASLTLAGLSNARIAAKRSVTETTIRKITEVVLSQYDTYKSTRANTFVHSDGNSTSKGQLVARRRLLSLEMPERFSEIKCHMPPSTAHQVTLQTSPAKTLTTISPLARRYANLLATVSASAIQAGSATETAECLFLNVMLSGYGDPDIIMHFRDNEIADTNKNGLREFVDAWGNPILFLRWAPGFYSAYQPAPYSSRGGDPFDIAFDDVDTFSPDGTSAATRIATRLTPLIISAGADGDFGMKFKVESSPGVFTPPDYPQRAFDPFYPVRSDGSYLGIPTLANAPDKSSPATERLFGSVIAKESKETADNVHSHSLSR